ncbi:exonuclease domain-containing protein [Vibrio amylolyticus]|uniref:3'-5' exonuclease n=1 Tax=Vibrio TaxID=662 RepID=UPI000C82E4CB|nr:3'-5' exonuclease [Vibrio sp. 10N.261.55.A7]PMJ93973.1 DNA polymerase III subunit epsilon [Vibrio sp. 10N.261.55.A7]
MKRLLNYFHPLERLKRARKRCLETMPLPEVLIDLMAFPTPNLHDLAKDVDFIVLDLETTGLDSQNDLILSVGWVEMSNGKVDLSTARHLYIDDDSQINPETAVINHITPQMLSEGVSIHDAMMAFFEAAKGKLVVAHGCVVEENFIQHYLSQYYHIHSLPLIWVDTLRLEKSMEMAISQHEEVDLTLSGTRQRYALPEYNGHNALADAISTAELFLVQQKRLTARKPLTVAVIYRLGR